MRSHFLLCGLLCALGLQSPFGVSSTVRCDGPATLLDETEPPSYIYDGVHDETTLLQGRVQRGSFAENRVRSVDISLAKERVSGTRHLSTVNASFGPLPRASRLVGDALALSRFASTPSQSAPLVQPTQPQQPMKPLQRQAQQPHGQAHSVQPQTQRVQPEEEQQTQSALQVQQPAQQMARQQSQRWAQHFEQQQTQWVQQLEELSQNLTQPAPQDPHDPQTVQQTKVGIGAEEARPVQPVLQQHKQLTPRQLPQQTQQQREPQQAQESQHSQQALDPPTNTKQLQRVLWFVLAVFLAAMALAIVCFVNYYAVSGIAKSQPPQVCSSTWQGVPEPYRRRARSPALDALASVDVCESEATLAKAAPAVSGSQDTPQGHAAPLDGPDLDTDLPLPIIPSVAMSFESGEPILSLPKKKLTEGSLGEFSIVWCSRGTPAIRVRVRAQGAGSSSDAASCARDRVIELFHARNPRELGSGSVQDGPPCVTVARSSQFEEGRTTPLLEICDSRGTVYGQIEQLHSTKHVLMKDGVPVMTIYGNPSEIHQTNHRLQAMTPKGVWCASVGYEEYVNFGEQHLRVKLHGGVDRFLVIACMLSTSVFSSVSR